MLPLWLLGIALVLGILAVPWWALIEASRARRDVARLRERLAALEREVEGGPKLEPVPEPSEAAVAPPPEPPVADRRGPGRHLPRDRPSARRLHKELSAGGRLPGVRSTH